jgi:surfeit locus 1 family protein
MTPRARALQWPAISAGLALCLLCSLGFWQLRRLAWKEALLARIEQRVNAPAVAPPSRERWAALAPEDYDYARVTLQGRFAPAQSAPVKNVLIFSQPPEGFGLEPGYLVLTPFALSGGGVVLVDRGFIAASKAKAGLREAPGGETALTGVLHAPQARNLFTPADTPEAGVWYTRDASLIAAALHIDNVAPFTLTLDVTLGAAPAEGAPRPVPGGGPEIANNHLSYAITWFGLAIALVAVFALYARAALRGGAPEGEG